MPEEPLVAVFKGDEASIALAQSLLDGEGIKYYFLVGKTPVSARPGSFAKFRYASEKKIWVSEVDADAARELLQQLNESCTSEESRSSRDPRFYYMAYFALFVVAVLLSMGVWSLFRH